MTSPSPQAGGCLLIACIFLGTGIGIWQNEPSIGVIAGTATGVLVALLVWWRDRARTGR